MPWPKPLSGALAAVAAALALPAQDLPPAAVLRPLQQFVRPGPSLGPVPRGSLLAGDDAPRMLTVGAPEEAAALDVDALLAALHRDDRDAGRLRWSVGEAGIGLSGAPERVAAAEAGLDAIAAAFVRPIAVTAWLLPPDGDDLPAVLDPRALAKALDGAVPLWTQTTRTQPFAVATLGNEQWSRYVRRLAVEVWPRGKTEDPRTDLAMAGIRVGCTVSPLPEGDDLVLDVQLACGEKVAVRRTPTGVAGQPDIELPEWRTALAQASARIPSGGALVVQLHGQQGLGPSLRLLLGARFLSPPPAALPAPLLLAPVGALLQTPPAPLVAALPQTESSEGPATEFTPADPAPFEAGDLGLYLQRFAGEDLAWSVQAGFLVLVAERPLQERVLAALRRLVAARLHNVEMQVEVRGVEAAVAAPPAMLWRQVLPVLACRPGGAFVGTEFRTIAAFGVEVSATDSSGVPFSRPCQSGLWSAVWLRAQGEAVHADWLGVVAAAAAPRRHQLGGKPDGVLGFVDTAVAAFPLHGDVEWGRELDLGDGPLLRLGNRELHTRQFVRMLHR